MNPLDTVCPWLIGSLEALATAAGRGQLGHGWIFSGSAGLGKRSFAYTLAGRLLKNETGCPPPATPADILAAIDTLSEGSDLHADLHRVRPADGKLSISVEQIRTMTDAIALTPHITGRKVVVIESAEAMTIAAQNALLKSLEEPTPNTWLLLISERAGRLLPTIRSRCQHLRLPEPTVDQALDWLAVPQNESGKLPGRWLSRSPVAAARALSDPDIFSNYREILDNINSICNGRGDPYTVAEQWQSGDTELALSSLIDVLADTIRRRMAPDHWNEITEKIAYLTENGDPAVPTDALFTGLKSAESLREQLGRGINVELALKALLVGLVPPNATRVES